MIDRSKILDFPTNFTIKAFGPNTPEFIDEISNLASSSCEENDTPTFNYQLSKNKRYISISVSVYVTSKNNLDNIYRALTSHPQIKMVI